MNLIIKFIFLFNLINFFIHCNTLKGLFVAIRHGDRSILEINNGFCLSDPYFYNESFFPEGKGQLVLNGKKRMYRIGLYLKDRYHKFLNNIHNIHVQSNYEDRFLESIQFVLKGIYKSTNQLKNNLFSIPIHLTHRSLEPDFSFPECESINNEINESMNSDFANNINKKYQNSFRYLSKHCNTNITNFYEACFIKDNWISESAAGLTLPDYVTTDISNQLSELLYYSFRLIISTDRVIRFRIGIYFNEIINRMYQIATNKENIKKAYFLSISDVFIIRAFLALNIDSKLIPFGSMIMFEFHQHNETKSNLDWDEYNSIKIFYLNETDQSPNKFSPYELKIPDCQQSEFCTIKQFKKSINYFLITEEQWNEECKMKLIIKKDNDLNIDSISIILILIVLLINLLLIILILKQNRIKKNYKFNHI